jgi:hypothetical protein
VRKPNYFSEEAWKNLLETHEARMVPGAAERLWFEMGRTLMSVLVAEGTLLTVTTLVIGDPKSSPDERLKLFQRLRKLTAGNLLLELGSKLKEPSKLFSDLEDLCAERNWLAHRLLEENGRDFYDQQKFEGLLKRLEKLRNLAQRLADELSEIRDKRRNDFALPPEAILDVSSAHFKWTFENGAPVLPDPIAKPRKFPRSAS